jgi:SpoVK/Ycf46/Vps4 family AAA+-type ATPase
MGHPSGRVGSCSRDLCCDAPAVSCAGPGNVDQAATATSLEVTGVEGCAKISQAHGQRRSVKALIRSHADGDDARFYAVAMQVAALAARSGHGNLAQELRKLVDEAKAHARSAEVARGVRPVPLARPRGELTGLLTAEYPKTRLGDLALAEPLQGRLERVILEQRQRDRLRSHGFAPLRKLLLVGPPGTGKTMTASALAGELGLPLFTIQLDGLITKFMGETAAKLRIVFEAIECTRGVYLFDEFDALGGRRGAHNDVGEIRRVLNSFLQFLEQDESESLMIGATNHVDLLDQALFRRFDAVFEYELPSCEVVAKVLKARLALLDTSRVDWRVAEAAAAGLSHAELTRACERAAKDALLGEVTQIETAGLVAALEERRTMRPF